MASAPPVLENVPGGGFRAPESGRRYPGLTRRLKRAFFPRYKYNSAHRRTAPKRARTGGGGRNYGLWLGRKVHKQIERLTRDGPTGLRKRNDAMQMHTKRAICAMRRWGWRALKAEVPAFCDKMGVATRADLLVRTADGGVAVVEWKTGYEGYWETGVNPMSGPLARRFSDSPLNQSLMQLLFTVMMLQRTYGFPITEAYVANVKDGGVWRYPIPHEMWAAREALEGHFVGATARRRRAARP
jgi:hypothetical protein